MTRALVGNDQKISHTFYAADDETVTEPTGTPTVVVTREDGTELVASTNATDEAGVGIWSYTLLGASHLTRTDLLRVRFSGTVSSRAVVEDEYVKVVRGRFFRVAELRAMKGLSSASTFPNVTLWAIRDIVEDFVEEYTEQAWVPQYRREIFDGNNCDEIFLSRINVRSLISVKVDGSAQTLTGWTVSGSGLLHTDGDILTASVPAGQNVEVQYEYGLTAPPLDLKNASLRLARHLALGLESSIPDRARMMQTQFGLFHLDTADEEHPTGLPEVDAVLCRYRTQQADWIVA